MKKTLLIFGILLLVFSCKSGTKENTDNNQNKDVPDPNNMIIRISEIEIAPNYLDEYILILKEEAAASVKLEPGVITIFPMFQKENPNEIRILEIYANKEAYESHLQTPHFKHYKITTLEMVESLKLIDMEAIDGETMSQIFEKLADKK